MVFILLLFSSTLTGRVCGILISAKPMKGCEKTLLTPRYSRGATAAERFWTIFTSHMDIFPPCIQTRKKPLSKFILLKKDKLWLVHWEQVSTPVLLHSLPNTWEKRT